MGKMPPVHTHTNEYPGYDIKPSDGKASTLKIWGMWRKPSLSSVPGLLWSGVVAADRVLSLGQIEQTACNPFNCLQKRAQACLRMLSTKCVYKSYICI